jgi:hypothetical protein
MLSVLIGVGAFLVAYGNIHFNVTRDRERAQLAGEKATSMLKIECANNLKRIAEMRQAFATGQAIVDNFEMTAWNIVSNGGLLVQVDQDTLAKVADIYYLIGSANTHQSRLLEMTFGVAGSLTNAPQLKQQQITYITNELNKLEPKLTELIAGIK